MLFSIYESSEMNFQRNIQLLNKKSGISNSLRTNPGSNKTSKSYKQRIKFLLIKSDKNVANLYKTALISHKLLNYIYKDEI